jgi:hypothetical protein
MGVYRPESAVIVPAREWAGYLNALDVSRAARLLATVKPDLNVSNEEYSAAIGRVRDYIAAGDTYQVNYTVRARYGLGSLGDDEPLDPLDYFLALVVRQPVPYAAFLDLGDTQVISLSPELFLRRDGDILESRPMKGTRPRGATHPADVALAYELAETEKERAENLMIVDMVRNDLGRVPDEQRPRADALCGGAVSDGLQMTSTGAGLPCSCHAAPLEVMWRSGASITGPQASHHGAHRRGGDRAACLHRHGGALPWRRLTSNIGIRTILHREGTALWAGLRHRGDATASPVRGDVGQAVAAPASGEWRSAGRRRRASRGKRRGRRPEADRRGTDLHLFETILLEAGGTYRHLDDHLARMTSFRSAPGLPFDEEKARSLLPLVRSVSAALVSASTWTPRELRVVHQEAPRHSTRLRSPCWYLPSAPTRTTRCLPTRPAAAASTTASAGGRSPRDASTPYSSTAWTW